MRRKTSKLLLFSLLFPVFSLAFSGLQAKEEGSPFRSTAYPIPRYVSLQADEVYVRSGPGKRFPVKWVIRKKGLPVEIILEFDTWRKVRDFEGEVGWVHKSLLTGKRTGLIQADDLVEIYQNPGKDKRLAAYLEPNVVVAIEGCDGDWCKIDASGYRGWAERKYIWGVYEYEKFN